MFFLSFFRSFNFCLSSSLFLLFFFLFYNEFFLSFFFFFSCQNPCSPFSVFTFSFFFFLLLCFFQFPFLFFKKGWHDVNPTKQLIIFCHLSLLSLFFFFCIFFIVLLSFFRYFLLLFTYSPSCLSVFFLSFFLSFFSFLISSAFHYSLHTQFHHSPRHFHHSVHFPNSSNLSDPSPYFLFVSSLFINFYFDEHVFSPVGWSCRIRRLHFWRGALLHQLNLSPGYDAKLHLMVRLQYWSFGKCGVFLHYHYS